MIENNVNKQEESPDSFKLEMNKRLQSLKINDDILALEETFKINSFKYDNKSYSNLLTEHKSLKDSSYYTDEKTNFQTVLGDSKISKSLPTSLKSHTLSLFPNQKNRFKNVVFLEDEAEETRFPYSTFNYRLHLNGCFHRSVVWKFIHSSHTNP